jgi:Mn2+/Fe2+ NRAMP family transporter
MGRHVNGRAHNVLAWGTIIVVIALTALLVGMTILGVG